MWSAKAPGARREQEVMNIYETTTGLREQSTQVERIAEIRLRRIEVLRERITELRAALEKANADARALKPEVEQARHDVVDLMRECDDLREQLARVLDLMPKVELLERAANYASIAQDRIIEVSCGGPYPKQEADDEEALDDLAARIREWLEEQKGTSDDNS